ncbi:hypothetical protein ACFTUC_32100 [Streptomyces sp. NPDC056944]|uniref:hypothetical protein n=1 Tax=Streptomyces sp. NPDC056944 TaxID=3345972 RepID=UPI00362568F9
MPRSTRRLPHVFVRAAAVFALSAGVLTPAVIHAPAAHADTGSAYDATLDDGRYRVGLLGDALWMKVSVLASTAPDAPVLASTDELSPFNGYRITDAPLTLPAGTALGDYPVRIDYRRPGGTTTYRAGALYSHKPHLGVSKVTTDRTTTSWDHRQVVLSGTTTSWDPATGERSTAPAGTQVKIAYTVEAFGTSSQRTGTATVATDGTFSLTVTPNGRLAGGTATIAQTPGVDPDDAAYLPDVQIEPLRYRITADGDKYRVLAGTDLRVTGRVERLTDEGWKPFPGAPVVATGTQPSSYESGAVNVLGSATSSATGTFDFPARVQYATDYVYTSLRPSPYVLDSSRPYDKHDIAVPQQFTYSPYTTTLDEYGNLVAKGQLGNGYCGNGEPVTLQASLDSGRTWRNLRSGWTDSSCQYSFSLQGYESAYYRVHHPVTNQLVAKAGPALKRARTATRFSAFTISPTRPTVNGKMTVSGTVQRKLNGVWKPLAGTKLTLVYKPKGENQWYWVTKSITTDSSGRFSYRATAYGDGSWALYLNTTGSYFYSETNAKYIDAR